MHIAKSTLFCDRLNAKVHFLKLPLPKMNIIPYQPYLMADNAEQKSKVLYQFFHSPHFVHHMRAA